MAEAEAAAEMQEPQDSMEVLAQLCEDQIPDAFQQLNQSRDTIAQIVQFCKDSYSASATGAEGSEEKTAQSFAQTRKYTSNALLNVAYHVQNLATILTTYVDGQLEELDRMLLDTTAVADRLRSHYDRNGAEVFRPAESTRTFEKQGKCTKLTGLFFFLSSSSFAVTFVFDVFCVCITGDDLPELARPLPKFERGGEAEKAF